MIRIRKMDKEKIERWKALAEIFVRTDVQAFIVDSSDNIYFADIILVGEDTFKIHCFGPEQRANQDLVLYWPLIVRFEEYKHFREAGR